MAFLTHLTCPSCGRVAPADRLVNCCPCGSPLLAGYDLDAVRRAVTRAAIAGRPADIWRYRELLPVADDKHITTFGEGWTPLQPAPAYGASIGVPGLLVKDEG